MRRRRRVDESSRAAYGSAHFISFFVNIFHVPRHNAKGWLALSLGNIYIICLNLCVRSL